MVGGNSTGQNALDLTPLTLGERFATDQHEVPTTSYGPWATRFRG